MLAALHSEDVVKRYGGRRDANEREIIDALERAGAVVAQVDGPAGFPDLVVQHGGRLLLVEVKDVRTGHGHKRAMRGRHDDTDPRFRELTPAQVQWWRRWIAHGGHVPTIVHYVDEALAAIGAVTPADNGSPGGAGVRQLR